MRRRTRLHPHQTARQSTEERQHLRPPKLLAQNRLFLCIDPVYLENMLRQSKPIVVISSWMAPCLLVVLTNRHFGTSMPQGGHPPSFDQLVGGHEQTRRHSQAERLSRFEIDHRFVLRWRLHRKVGRIGAAQDAVDIGRRLPK